MLAVLLADKRHLLEEQRCLHGISQQRGMEAFAANESEAALDVFISAFTL
ncbi:hypothetical protein LCM08_16970 [Salipiger pacificus]|nr:hypothetical protein [Alloyangia pacifica]